MKFRMAVKVWFRFIAINTLFFNPLLTRPVVDMEVLYLQQDVGRDSRQLFSESVLNEVSVYTWEPTRGVNSLKGLAWAAKGFLNDLD